MHTLAKVCALLRVLLVIIIIIIINLIHRYELTANCRCLEQLLFFSICLYKTFVRVLFL